MKIFWTLVLVMVWGTTFSQATSDVATLDSTIETLYSVISGEPGSTRDWPRFKNLFAAEARLIPTRKDAAGNLTCQALTPDEYVKLFSARIATGFYERELSRTVEEYGTVIHVFSTYETKEQKGGPVTNRGINSIQLFKDKDRYYILSIFWCAESMGFTLPEKYLR
jgi:hypothetical protein